MSNRLSNSTTTLRHGRLGDQDFAYEMLPAPIRRALRQAAVKLCTITITDRYRAVLRAVRMEPKLAHLSDQAAEDLTVELYLEAFAQAELGEIALFSADFHVKHGQSTPHVLAEVSIQRAPEGIRPRRRHRWDRNRRLLV